jgi:hypothetical protein
MREQEMRLRVFRFLRARMRNMIMPATVGIGLAVGGCARETSTPIYSAPIQDSAAPANRDVLGPDSPAPGPDLAVADAREVQSVGDIAPDSTNDGLGRDTPIYGIDMSPPDLRNPDVLDSSVRDVASLPDQAVALDGAGIDGSSDLGGTVTKYGVPIPDAAADTAGVAPLYSASIPDAAADGMPAVRYMAQMPDAGAEIGGAVALYVAQMPDAGIGAQPLYMAPQA